VVNDEWLRGNTITCLLCLADLDFGICVLEFFISRKDAETRKGAILGLRDLRFGICVLEFFIPPKDVIS
jgi:hypothetical protein